MKKILLIALVPILFFASCAEEKKADKQTQKTEETAKKRSYAHGSLPSNLDASIIDSTYAAWKEKYVTSDGCPEGAKRVLFDDMSHTVSEGIGYGMLASVMMQDVETFEALHKYYKTHLDDKGLMHWKIDAKGQVAGENAATDADVDVAYALLMAHKLIGGENYLEEAKKVIGRIRQHMVEPDTFVLKPGDAWGGSETTNPSYFAPAYFKVFAEVTEDESWLKVSDKCYEILFKSYNPETGLVPDWCKADGTTPAADVEWAKFNGTRYFYDAARTPWRITKDYIWYGDERAETYCETINNFVKKIGISKVTEGYDLEGNTFRKDKTSAFVGCFAVASMASYDQSFINDAYKENINTFNDTYFNDILRLLTLQMQHGMFVKYQS